MMYEFIFEDTTPTTHCADPVVSGATGGSCNGNKCLAGGNSHHACADRNIGPGTHMYCECRKNKDQDHAGRAIKHYFRENILGDQLKCPSCRDNCGY